MKKIFWMTMIMAALVLWAGIVTAAVNRFFITDKVETKAMATMDTSAVSPGMEIHLPRKDT